ncbi:MAG: transcriptional regulator [Micropruina sp.]|uniref:winged helix-turn-helix domain-containing protein n=1 Tax=Micropruina sp. TaxID=2737536 RepID=UPI0039E64EB6
MTIDEQFHSPVRFSIMATLVGLDRAEFAFVRDTVGVSDSVLSKQAGALEAAGYLKITKGHVGKRPRTWYSLTDQGRAAFRGHLDALRALAEAAAGYAAQQPH